MGSDRTVTGPRRTALVTASYAGDFERCRLLCETIDRHVTGATRHLLLVSGPDVPLFRQLEGPHREVVSERDILPGWLHDLPDPLSGFRRRVWLSRHTVPLRGWHVQQLRRIAIAGHVGEDALFYCDSDAAFLRPFDCATLWKGPRLRLFRRDGRLLESGHDEQRQWARNAARALAAGTGDGLPHDYIATLVAWRADTTRAMMQRLEAVAGRHWIAALARTRRFSECMLYGCQADSVDEGRDHFHDATELCRIYWKGPRLDTAGIRDFVAACEPDQVAVGLQSFVGMDMADIRRALHGAD
ncbi:hypothetical protein CSC94_15260 [Zhengella mangrovi]|uniref:Nucleotide-diphospho-sugar transferase domain-containing protein n=1 Tax=Zhengella mangrovi TaxID=1982044 RepID=A0A2G1QLA3_9HYPH|nr:DUF6492 family protein [Zhengella mangrovi]PHP66282.1 hypothetical protein CSC94_15260 [Zhengella mangrovi]